MDVDDPLVARLHGLPWEFLFDDGYLALQRKTLVVRSLDLAGPRRPLDLTPPLRVLAILSEPRDLPALRLRDERELLTATWEAQGGVTVDWLCSPTLEDLCRELARRPANVLHFLGHGDFDPDRREGRLYFTGGEDESVPVAASTLAIQLADFESLRLVFLNACQTAATAVEAPFAGVATALLRSGLPAVVAMQLPIPDGAAIAFASSFYASLADGEPVDRAVTEGRLALHRRDPGSIAWGIPLFYLRGREASGSPPLLPARRGPAARPRRRPAIATAALAGLAAASVILWQQLPGDDTRRGEKERTATRPAVPGGQEPSDRTGEPSAEAVTEPATGQDLRPAEAHDDEEPASLTRPAAPPVRLHDGEPARLTDIDAYVTADFLRLGPSYVRITLSPEGAAPKFQAVMGPAAVEAGSPRGRVVVDVLAIDWNARTVTVRGRLGGDDEAPEGSP